MRFNLFKHCCLISFASFLLFSCSSKTEQLETELLTEYVPLQPGKYITYRVDSLVFPNFGRNTEIHKYQVKHVIDAMILDNENRPSYRVFRYLRDSAGTQPWVNNGSYFITVLNDQVEVIEDNLRFIKIHMPMREGFTWKGNRHLGDNPYNSLFNFSNDDNMADWDFYFDTFESSFSYKGNNYADVWSVESADEIYNVPITDANAYAAKTRAVDRYAKNIGLVYKEFELWEYQPNPGGSGGPYKTGFGVTMWMIDHN
jgi:hypothetical protein